ncbi:MAG: multiheme c-type cytochrome [Planctomycetota bacterium]|jgi:hypothetical protein
MSASSFSRDGRRLFWTGLAALLAMASTVLMQSDESLTSRTAFAQDNDAPQAKFQGLRSCIPCHNEDTNRSSVFAALSPEFCSLNEIATFENDKHRQAYELLTGPLGQQMQKLLATARNDADYKVTDDKNCLSCHANWHWKEGFEKPPLFEFGVTCESCHGASSLWEGPHDLPEWRKESPETKENKFGFIDVRNPIRRAKQCFSCHIGNVQEGKVVTHEMYAAGHPPLPGIEIESFAEQMPSHWRFLHEKGEFKFRDEYVKANFPGVEHDPLTDLPRTKSTLIGGVMAMREALNLFASQANDESSSGEWPELAVFDCSACHHDLAAPGWRQKRGYGSSVPGRPQMFVWPEALVKAAIRHRAGDDDAKFKADWDAYHGSMEKLRRSLDRRPFGAPADLKTAVLDEGGLIEWLDELAQDLFTSRVQQADAKRALQTLASLPDDSYPDYHTARQLAWAIRTIQTELGTGSFPEFKPRPDEETEKAAIGRAIDNLKLFTAWRDGARADALSKTDSQLGELATTLRLTLPAGDMHVITDQLPEALKATATYDPEWFRRQLDELRQSLSD